MNMLNTKNVSTLNQFFMYILKILLTSQHSLINVTSENLHDNIYEKKT